MPKINSVRGLRSIKAISKCELNLTSGFQDIAFTSNSERTDRRTDRQGHSIIRVYKTQLFQQKSGGGGGYSPQPPPPPTPLCVCMNVYKSYGYFHRELKIWMKLKLTTLRVYILILQLELSTQMASHGNILIYLNKMCFCLKVEREIHLIHIRVSIMQKQCDCWTLFLCKIITLFTMKHVS